MAFAAAGRIIARTAVRRAFWVMTGVLLALIQGQTAVQAAELPQVLTGVNARFEGAQLPVVTGNNMVINQVADKATLHWQSFNIGAENQVEFKQPSAAAVALNRIFDAAPSQVNGKLTANGQIYLINQNGIVFGKGAQVNTQSLVASTLDIDDRVYKEIGFVNAINESSGALPAFDSFGRPMGEIRVAEGAKLESAKSGRVLIFAPTIVNKGTISTPEGQQVLAAAKDRVLIAASDDPNLRGLLVEVSTGGDVTNLGSLIAERGNISLFGMAVNQEGVARATTSVSLNGSVRLLAQDMNGTLAFANDLVPREPKPARGGEVRLGAGSVTEVVPDAGLDAQGAEILAVDAQAQPQSRIDISGAKVRLESGSRVTSTGGAINLTAAANPGQPDLSRPADPGVNAELVVESGAIVDASGDDSAAVSVSRNVVNVEARGNELADSPVQRNGPIRNKTLQVDIRRGTEFLNIDGAVASVGRSTAERQSAGGSITARSEGRIVLEAGSRVDVSGGRVTYTEGLVGTSRLRQANGKVVDISKADPDQTYVGLVANPMNREAGYVEGKDAGTLILQARGLELSGDIRAGSVAGPNQRQRAVDLGNTPAFARPFDQTPLGGALALTLLRTGLPELIIGSAPTGSAPAVAPLLLPPEQIRASGAARIGLVNAGPILVNTGLQLPERSELTLTGTQVSILDDVRIAGGQLRLHSSNAAVGQLVVPDESRLVRIDGSIDLSGTWVNDNPLLNTGRPAAPIVLDGGRLVVDSGSAIEVSAASRLDVSAGAFRAADGRFTGGRGGSMTFATGAVDSNPFFGSRLALAGALRAFGFVGGGEISIDTERIEIVPESRGIGDNDLLLDGNRQFGLREVSDGFGNEQFVFQAGASTFQMGGFGTWSLTSSRSDLQVALGAAVRLRTATYLLTGINPSLAPTGAAMSSLATPAFNPDFLRLPAALTLGTNEDLANAIGPVADLSITAGASISADAGSAISLRSTTSLFLDGTINAPAGRILLELGGGAPTFRPEQMIWLGGGSALTANAMALIDTLNPLGLRPGVVLDAGRITVRAEQGSIVGAAGAQIAVNGAAANLDTGFGMLRPTEVAAAAGAIELVAAESLLYRGRLSGVAPAGTGVPGGHLTVGLDPTYRGVPALLGPDPTPRGPHTLVMQDFAGNLPGAGSLVDEALQSTGFVPLTQLRLGGFSSLDLVVRSSAVGTDGTGTPVPDTPESLPVIEFPLDLDLRLDRSIGLDAAILKTNAAQVSLAAPYVSIGYRDARVRLDGTVPDKTSSSNPLETSTPIRLTPTAGAGTLHVAAGLIELVGESVTQGFGDAATGRGVVLDSSGDLRMRGVRTVLKSDYAGLFRTAGVLSIDAERVYPTTLSAFELGVEGTGGRIVLAGGGATSAPLSIGGELTVAADEIVQGGALFAPLGQLNLNAGSALRFTAGSLTSTSAAAVSAPFFRTEPGGALILPAPTASADQIVFVETVVNPEFERELPQKHINLAAPVVDLQPGSAFDLNGGSKVNATQFVPGPGGSRDILLADLATGAAIEPNKSFAIMPGIDDFAPYDPLETPAAEDVLGLRIGDTLILEDGTPNLPAGEYAVLPARYALFGGFLVTPAAGTQDLAPNASLRRLDGAPILAGRFGEAGNDRADSRSQGFAVETGARVRERAEYVETPLDDFYSEGVLRAPRDAGNLVIRAGDTLRLQGELIRGNAINGLGAEVDIATAAALSVVNRLTGANDIELGAMDLANLGADSLLIGGTRMRRSDGLHIEALSSTITVDAGVQLELPELLLIGGSIIVGGKSEQPTLLASTVDASSRSTDVIVDDDAAVLAVSDRQLTLNRVGSSAGASGIVMAADSTLEARGGLVLDAAGDVDAAGHVEGEGKISLGAARISIGATDGRAIDGGLILSNADLRDIAGSELRLRSSGVIDVYGGVSGEQGSDPLTFRRLSLDAQAIRGLANENLAALLQADIIALQDGAGASIAGPAPAPAAGSRLELRAGEFQLGTGSLAIRGFGQTTIDAATFVTLTGTNELTTAGNLSINAPLITAAVATSGTIRATGHLTVNGGDAPGVAPSGAALGTTLTISAADIDFAGRIVLPSGNVRLIQDGDAGNPLAGAGLRVADHALIDVSGAALSFGPRTLATPGGSIDLTATTGDLRLAAAQLDVSAPSAGGAAGELRLWAPLGTMTFSPGMRLLARDADGEAGSVDLDAGGLASTDASIANPITPFITLLGAGGFHDSLALRLRRQDIAIDSGTSIDARQIRLVSDAGSIGVSGALNASGAEAGSIWLAAGDRLDVSGTLTARASADRGRGGRVDLYALDADADDPTGASDVVNLATGSLIDVSGGAGGAGGEVFVHGRRLDTTGDGQTDSVLLGDLSGNVSGAGRSDLVATRVLRDPNAVQVADPVTGELVTRVTITGSDIEIWRSETEAFLTGVSAPTAGPLQITAGLQVESTGDLVLLDRWNFMEGWHFGQDLSDPTAPRLGLTGITTLRAARNMNLQADLTDAFAQQFVFGFLPIDAVTGPVSRTDGTGSVVEELAPRSWGYRITAGADLASADVMAFGDGASEVRLGSGVRVRTGSADINIAVTGDLRLEDGAAVYSAGWDRGLSAQLKQAMAPATDAFGLTAYDFFGTFLNGAQFADGGGTVAIVAGGDLIADTAPGLVTAWLPRVGSGVVGTDLYSLSEGFGAIPTHWGVAYDQFRNGIGAFGGGDLRIAVAGDVTKAVLAVPTTGRVSDGVVADTSTGQILFQPSQRSTEILGGGRLDVRAGGGLLGGQVVIGRGAAAIRTGGDSGVGDAPQLYTGGDARVDWTAGGALQLAGLEDPTMVALSDTQLGLMAQILSNIASTADFDNRFFTYADSSKVSLASLKGDVTLDGAGFGGYLPPSFAATAFGGDVNLVTPSLDFFPSATGTLELLARGNITGGFSSQARTRQSDQDRSLLPSVDRPDILAGAIVPATVPVHAGDTAPNLIVARDGAIRSHPGSAGFWTLELAKPAVFRAGTDISNLSVRVQNIATDALTSFQAGRDIVQGELRDFTGRFAANDQRIFEIWGPGSAEFVAGRNISLGTSAGIETIGDTKNAALASQGAALRLLVGTGGEPAYDRFIDVYLSTRPSAYRDELNAFLAQVEASRAAFPTSNAEPHELPIPAGKYGGELAQFLQRSGIPVVSGDPVGTFRGLDRPLQRAFLTQVLFRELKDWGTVSETADRADRLNYIRAYTAMDTLFALGDPLGVRAGGLAPGALTQTIRNFLTIADPRAANDAQVQLFGTLFPQVQRRGDISLLLSQVQTLAGGDLSVVAPGGDINAGAADADVIDKKPSDLGIVTARGGDINIAVDNDLLVNSTRVFALQGDLLVWSSNGNIDAGKGAKTVTSVPDPITRIDPNTGNTIIEFPPAVSGSGLQGENAALFAPRGAVNAGDAGIRTSGDLTIGAVEIVGTDNIDVGGIEIGFSTTEVAPVAPPGAAAASSAATKGVESQTSMLGEENELGERKILGTEVRFISVEVLSFGEDCKPGDKDCD
jgi:filamentous hemagglutinin family protein